LETKAGLALVVLLAGAFGFMVWQKWTHRQQETYARSDDVAAATPAGEQPDSDPFQGDQPPLEFNQTEPIVDNSPGDPFGDPFGEHKEIVQVGEKQLIHPLRELETVKPSDTPPKQPTHADSEESDPFTSAASSTATSRDHSTADQTADPFGEEWTASPRGAGSRPQEKSEQPPLLDLDGVAKKTEQPAASTEEDPFENRKQAVPVLTTNLPDNNDNPFATNDSKLSASTPVDSAPNTSHKLGRPDPTPVSSAKPLEIPDGPALTRTAQQPADKTGPSFADPIPILERVPERADSASRNPFGEFEVVPAGSSRAASITEVTPEDRSRTKPSSRDPAREQSPRDDPFAEANERPREFREEGDGFGSHDSTQRTYRVQENDTYWEISRKMYGSSRYHLALANFNKQRVSDPTRMRLGQEILIPPARELERTSPGLIAGSPTAKGTIVRTAAEDSGFSTDQLGNPQYRVGENDTLSAIAQRHLGRASRWIQIYELNRKQIPDPNQLQIGTVLSLPADASNVRVIGDGTGSTLR
jgi:nucleoid-associated protein YgaU